MLVDLLLDSHIQNNFINYKSFPFSAKGTIGIEMFINSIFIIWEHYYKYYQQSYKDNVRTFKGYQQYKPEQSSQGLPWLYFNYLFQFLTDLLSNMNIKKTKIKQDLQELILKKVKH